jgi:starch synthase
MVSSEAAPLAKTGGLADVVGALPAALQAFGDQAAVVIPRYASIDLRGLRRVYDRLPVFLGLVRYDASIYQAHEEVPIFLVDCPPLFGRPGLYGEAGADYPDNHIRFSVFCRAAIAVARYVFHCDILHCHDWQSGLVPPLLKTLFATDPTFFGVKTLFTIHNLGYQGLFPRTALADAAIDPALFHPAGLEFYGQVSYIKGGIEFADALNTVSPTYAREIQTPELGFGLDGALRAHSSILSGIINGVDYREWSPEADSHLPQTYSVDDLSGKAVCKEGLIAEMGLDVDAVDRPLIGVVSRLATQKGADLIAEAAPAIVDAGACLVMLGSGDPALEDLFQRMAADFPGRIAVRIGYDNYLAHLIEAGSDIFLMPSLYEPCGLNQIYSLRYGTVPVVRATGGLDDTIDTDTGFKFAGYTAEALLGAVREALKAFGRPDLWRDRMRLGMRRDFSWKASAAQYSALYRRLLGAD